MKRPSIKDVLAKVKTAKKQASKAVSKARTGAEKRKAKRLKTKAEQEIAEIKRYEARLEELKKQEKRAKTKGQVQSKQRQIDDMRSRVSIFDRIAVGIKKNANKAIDKSLKKHGL